MQCGLPTIGNNFTEEKATVVGKPSTEYPTITKELRDAQVCAPMALK